MTFDYKAKGEALDRLPISGNSCCWCSFYQMCSLRRRKYKKTSSLPNKQGYFFSNNKKWSRKGLVGNNICHILSRPSLFGEGWGMGGYVVC